MSAYAVFNERGDCQLVIRSKEAPPEGALPVEESASANEICLYRGAVLARRKVDVALPSVIEVGQEIALPDFHGSYWKANGLPDAKSIVGDAPTMIYLTLHGLCMFEAAIEVRSFAEQRRAAYPSLVDQLDMIYHGGLDEWRQQIEAIKSRYPKPGE